MLHSMSMKSQITGDFNVRVCARGTIFNNGDPFI